MKEYKVLDVLGWFIFGVLAWLLVVMQPPAFTIRQEQWRGIRNESGQTSGHVCLVVTERKAL